MNLGGLFYAVYLHLYMISVTTTTTTVAPAGLWIRQFDAHCGWTRRLNFMFPSPIPYLFCRLFGTGYLKNRLTAPENM